jgi:TetR/AcrR family transcriptional repressor of nem operon
MARVKEFDQQKALSAAMDVFWRHGYEGTSLPMLLKAMRIGRQSLYDTFGDKRALFLAAIDRYCAMLAEQLLGVLAPKDAALDAIRACLANVVAFHASFPDRRACFMANTTMEVAPHDKAVAKKVEAFMGAMEGAFAHALANAAARGEIARSDAAPSKNTRALARHLVAVVNGIAVAAKSGASRAALEDIAAVALEAVEAR